MPEWWAAWLACAPAGPPPPLGVATDAGHYRVALDVRAGPGGRAVGVRVTDAGGRALEHAVVTLRAGDLQPAIDPGECDDIGPERCFHPGGWYWTLPIGSAATRWTVTVDGEAGVDVARLELPPR